MANIVSEITAAEVADYIRLDEASPSELKQIETFIVVAKSFIRAYTGLTDAEIDTYPDIIIAVYVLSQDMYDNRTMYIDSREGGINKVVDAILGMHRRNFLPSASYFTADLRTIVQGEASTINITSNDFIAFGSAITDIAGTTPIVDTPIIIDNATVVLNAGGTITITPDEDFVGTVTFEYTATQPNKSTVRSSVSIIVSASDEDN